MAKCIRCKKEKGVAKILKADKGFSCLKCLDVFMGRNPVTPSGKVISKKKSVKK